LSKYESDADFRVIDGFVHITIMAVAQPTPDDVVRGKPP
jgi:sulfur transfer protein SufE